MLLVMIFFPLRDQECHGDDDRKYLRRGNCPPYAVKLKEYRQYQDGEHLKYQRAEEGDRRRYTAIVEGGEKCRRKNVDARKQEREGKQVESMLCHLK